MESDFGDRFRPFIGAQFIELAQSLDVGNGLDIKNQGWIQFKLDESPSTFLARLARFKRDGRFIVELAISNVAYGHTPDYRLFIISSSTPLKDPDTTIPPAPFGSSAGRMSTALDPPIPGGYWRARSPDKVCGDRRSPRLLLRSQPGAG